MKAAILASASWGPDGVGLGLDPRPPGFHPAPEPPRPELIPPGQWRRLSRAARLACAAAAPVLAGRPDLGTLPLFWGTLYGEFSSTLAFLRSLHARGPGGASPLAFQNAVHNAPAGHLSIGFGLKGPSETLCAGPLTSLRVLERAMAWVELRRAPVLVVVGDDLGPDVRLGLELAGAGGVIGEGAAALILGPGEGLRFGAPRGPRFRRAQAWPGERVEADPDALAHDLAFGLGTAGDLMALIAAHRAGGGSLGFPGSDAWLVVEPG